MSRIHVSLSALVVALLVTAPAAAGWEEGVAAFKKGNFELARAELTEVVQAHPDSHAAHFMLGQALLRLGESSQALHHLRKAYDLDPNQVSYQLAVAQGLLLDQQYEAASKALGKVDPQSLPEAQRESYLQLSAAAHQKLVEALMREARSQPLGERAAIYQQALPAAKALAGAEPSYENLLTLGEVQLGAGVSAVETFRMAAARNGADWSVQYYLGVALSRDDEHTAALGALKDAMAKTDDEDAHRTVWKQIGFVNEKLGHYPQAREAYERAGSAAQAQRVAEIERTLADNLLTEAENAQIRAMEEEAKRLEEELKELEGGGSGD